MKDIGKMGEDLAAETLEEKGYEIIRRNYINGKGELDIIAWSPPNAMGKKTLIFVEVKTRSDDYFGKPDQFIGQKKRQLMTRTAGAFMEEIHYDWAVRFDVVSILFKDNKLRSIRHIEDAFWHVE